MIYTTNHIVAQVKRSLLIFWEAHILTLIKNTKEGPKSRDGDSVRISQYNNIFEKGSAPNWSEEVLVIKKVQNTVLWT